MTIDKAKQIANIMNAIAEFEVMIDELDDHFDYCGLQYGRDRKQFELDWDARDILSNYYRKEVEKLKAKLEKEY